MSSAARLAAKAMAFSTDNIKRSIYIGPHTWEPCVPDSLTHRLNPCGHLVVTEMLEVCGRNCVVPKYGNLSGIRDLDRVFFCPSCPDNERATTHTGEQKEFDNLDKKPSDFISYDLSIGRNRAIHVSDTRQRTETLNAKKEMGIRCKSVLWRFDREPLT